MVRAGKRETEGRNMLPEEVKKPADRDKRRGVRKALSWLHLPAVSTVNPSQA